MDTVKDNVKLHNIFNRRDVIAEGWYWLLPSRELAKKTVKAVSIAGQEIAVFRGADGSVAALDAYCPHMGAHFCEGKVEGNQLRCFFHNWRFDKTGTCTDIPCMKGGLQKKIATTAWHVQERNGLIWIWLGNGEPYEPIPEPPELQGFDYQYLLGSHFTNKCHPNVTMVNAIDEQHFRSVHYIPSHILSMKCTPVTGSHLEFRNMGKVPNANLLGKLLGLLYRNQLTYNLDYWYGSNGCVCFGPDVLHCYLMFALRMAADGSTEGYILAFTKRRKFLFGAIINWFILRFTLLAARYFGSGDNRVFETIRFQLKTPLPADHTILSFIQHLERQKPWLKM